MAAQFKAKAKSKVTEVQHDAIATRIEKAGFEVVSRLPLLNGLGYRYRLFSGGIVTQYHTGRSVPQGRLTEKEKIKLKYALEHH